MVLFLLGATFLVSLVAEPDTAVEFAKQSYVIANVAAVAYVISSERRGGISLLVSFFFLFFVAIPAHVQIDSGVFPSGSSYTNAQLAAGFVLSSLAQIGYLAGEAIGDIRKPKITELTAAPRPDSAFYRRVIVVAVLVSLVMTAYIGVGTLFTSRGDASNLPNAATIKSQLTFIGRSISLVGVVVCVYLFATDRDSRRRPSFVFLSVIAFGFFFILNFPPALARFELLGPVLAILGIIVPLFKATYKCLFNCVTPFFLILVFPAIKSLGLGGSVDIGSRVGQDVRTYLESVDFDAFKQMVDTTIYISNGHSYRDGTNFFGVIFFWVPRAIWSNKPLDTGQVVSGSLGYSYTNVSSPLPAEAFVSFGLLGVVIVFFAAGVWVSRLESAARLGQITRDLRQQNILYALTMGFVVIILRGALDSVAPMFATGFAFYFVVTRLHARTLRRRRFGGSGQDLHPRPAASDHAPI